MLATQKDRRNNQLIIQGGYASAIKTAYHPFLLYADWHTRVLKAEEEGKAQKVKQLRSLVSTVPGLSTVIRS